MDRRGFFGVLGGIAAFPLVNKLLPKPKSRLLHTAGVVNEFRFRYSCPSTSAAEKIVLMRSCQASCQACRGPQCFE